MIENYNLPGILKRFFWHLQATENNNGIRIWSAIQRNEDALTVANHKIEVLNQKIEMLTKHVADLMDALKDNENLKAWQKLVIK